MTVNDQERHGQWTRIQLLAALGFPTSTIARMTGTPVECLERDHADDLELGPYLLTELVAQTLLTKALSGENAAIALWLKSRGIFNGELENLSTQDFLSDIPLPVLHRQNLLSEDQIREFIKRVRSIL